MSNVIKSGYVYYDKEEKKVIDSDSRAGLFTPLYFKKVETIEEEETDAEEVLTAQEQHLEEEYTSIQQAELEEEVQKQLNEAKRQADEILSAAKEEAETLKQTAMEAGRQEGRQEGMRLAEAETQRQRQEIREEQLRLQKDYEDQVKQLEPQFADIMIRYIEKITGIMAEEKKEIILYLISSAMKKVDRNQYFIIKVSPEDFNFVDSQRDKLFQGLKENAKVEITEDSTLKKNQCMIETDDRVIDCSLDVQLKRLTEDLKLLSVRD